MEMQEVHVGLCGCETCRIMKERVNPLEHCVTRLREDLALAIRNWDAALHEMRVTSKALSDRVKALEVPPSLVTAPSAVCYAHAVEKYGEEPVVMYALMTHDFETDLRSHVRTMVGITSLETAEEDRERVLRERNTPPVMICKVTFTRQK